MTKKACHITGASPTCFPFFSSSPFLLFSFFLFNISASPFPPLGSHIEIFTLCVKYLSSSVLVPLRRLIEAPAVPGLPRGVPGLPLSGRFREVLLLPPSLPSHSWGFRDFCSGEHDRSLALKEPTFIF